MKKIDLVCIGVLVVSIVLGIMLGTGIVELCLIPIVTGVYWIMERKPEIIKRFFRSEN